MTLETERQKLHEIAREKGLLHEDTVRQSEVVDLTIARPEMLAAAA